MSWHTLQSVRSPRVMLGRFDGALERLVEAKETSYTDAKSGKVVYAYHAKIDRLQANSPYLYGLTGVDEDSMNKFSKELIESLTEACEHATVSPAGSGFMSSKCPMCEPSGDNCGCPNRNSPASIASRGRH